MIAVDNQTIYITLAVLASLLLSKQILHLCLSLFLSITSVTITVVSIFVCLVLMLVVLGPASVLTCYFVGKIDQTKGNTSSTFVYDVCGIKPHKANRY